LLFSRKLCFPVVQIIACSFGSTGNQAEL
jgi:hypothetical protein